MKVGQVKVVAGGDISGQMGTKVFTEDGRELKSICGVRFSHKAGDIPVVEIDFAFPVIEGKGYARAWADGRGIKRVEFDDGEVIEFGEIK